MSLTREEKQTVDAYNQNAKAWAKSRNVKGYWAAEKQKFKKYLPTGKLLEIGAGGGRDAKDLVKRGYDYIGTDVSKELLKEARNNNPGVTFLNQSVYELNFPPQTFDGFWACAVLFHMPKKRIGEALQSIHKVIKKGGVGFISLKKGNGAKYIEGDHVGISYKRFFSFYQEDEFTNILKSNNFHTLESYEILLENKPWLVFFVKTI